MPKVKSRKTVVKRFKITQSGKVLRRAQNARHLRMQKSKKRIRQYKKPIEVSASQAKWIKEMIQT